MMVTLLYHQSDMRVPWSRGADLWTFSRRLNNWLDSRHCSLRQPQCRRKVLTQTLGAFGDTLKLCIVGHFSVNLRFVINSITELLFGVLCILQLCKEYGEKLWKKSLGLTSRKNMTNANNLLRYCTSTLQQN
jgi:hypothetical protein